MVQSGHVGHTAVIPEELNNTAAHALIMFKNPKMEVEPYFLNYQYQTNTSRKKLDNITVGNTIRAVSTENVILKPPSRRRWQLSHLLIAMDGFPALATANDC